MSDKNTTDDLRSAKAIVNAMLREIAADPLTRRSRDPYVRGQRYALNDFKARIARELANVKDA